MDTATKVNPVEAFVKKVREDGQLRNQIELLKNQEKTQAMQEIVKIAGKLNYKFGIKEYEEFARMQCTRNAKQNRPITDEELILVACGRN